MTNIYKNAIESTIDSCTATLDSNIRHIGDDVGWHQHLGAKKIGIVATSIALLYYKMVKKDCPEKESCLRFLIKKQNDDGGWPYISNTQGESNVESTCWTLQALNEYLTDENKTSINPVINKGVDWLLKQHEDNNNRDNGWPFSKGSVPRVFTTAFTLRTLHKLGSDKSQEYESALQWILDAQNDDGGWGELPEMGSNCFYTSYVVVSLLELGYSVSNQKIIQASDWLKHRLKQVPMFDPSLLCYLEFIERGEGNSRTRISSFHYVLPYVAQALMVLDINDELLIQAMNVINERAKNGYVEHPMLENTRIKPIWAVYDSIYANIEFQKRIKNWNKQYEIISFRKKLVPLRRLNPFRVVFRYRRAILYFLTSFVLLFVCVKYVKWDIVQNWWMSQKDKTMGQIMISFTGSLLVVVISEIIETIKRIKSNSEIG